MNSEEKKLHDIGIADFVLTDLMLYLDTHLRIKKPWNTSITTHGSKHRWSGNRQRSLPTAQGSRRK